MMEKLFVSPVNCRVIDIVNPETKLGAYSGRNFDQFKEQYPDVKIATWQEFEELQNNFFITNAKEIDAYEFHDILGLLPPSRHQFVEGFEIFHNPEAIAGAIVSWYGRYENRFFTFADRKSLPIHLIVEKLKSAL